VTCAYTGFLLGFEFYLGKDKNGIDSSAIGIVDRLLHNAGLTSCRGHILYTDNWYTSTKLAMHIHRHYKMLFVGTIKPSEKKARIDYDNPFHKLSKASVECIARGWSRHAMTPINNNSGMMQCTMWTDRKQVIFLHTHLVEPVGNVTSLRYMKGKQHVRRFHVHQLLKIITQYMNGVDIQELG
jgi:hypothetical protein